MSNKSNGIPPALKHAVYSGLALLPGEDPAEFEKLRDELTAEYSPEGASEKHIVHELARLIWRKQHLSTYRLAEEALQKSADIRYSLSPTPVSTMFLINGPEQSPEEVKALEKRVIERQKAELGWTLDLANLGVATIEYLMTELSLADRLDAMIDRGLKRLLFARGLKSISGNDAAAKSQQPKKLTNRHSTTHV